MWTGKDANTEALEPKNRNKNKISVTKPVSKLQAAMPTHQESRADYVVTHNQMEPPQVSNQQGGNGQNQNNSSVGADLPMLEEPAAFNSGGGFSSW